MCQKYELQVKGQGVLPGFKCSKWCFCPPIFEKISFNHSALNNVDKKHVFFIKT